MTPSRADLWRSRSGVARHCALCLPAIPAATLLMLEAADRHLAQHGIEGAPAEDARIVLAEAINNIVEHAYRDTPRGSMAMRLRISRDAIHVVLVDWGDDPTFFGPAAAPEPSDLAEGGYGRYLIEMLVRRQRRCRAHGCNCLCLDLPLTTR